MMSEKPTLSGMPNRQKIITVVIVVLLVIIIWQLMKLFSGKKAPPKPPPAAVTAAAHNAPSPTPTVAQQTPVQAAPQPPVQSTPSISSEVAKMQQEMQEKYIRSLNDLQMLRIQRDIAETNQAIVTSKLATVTAEKNITQLLTPPPVPQSPSGFTPTSAGAPGSPSTGGPSISVIEYSVASLSMQHGKWSAVLISQGKSYSVNVGDVLPLDGSVVVTIDRSGVEIEKGGERKKISMLSPGY